jgi:ABC-type glutathione transport system ATPase component
MPGKGHADPGDRARIVDSKRRSGSRYDKDGFMTSSVGTEGQTGGQPLGQQGEFLSEKMSEVRLEISKAIVGQTEVVDGVLIALLAGGHVLLEGAPGLGKTMLVRTLAQAVALKYSRIQFTPDLHLRGPGKRGRKKIAGLPARPYFY